MLDTTWVYVALCVIAPLAWGLLAEWVFGRLEGYLQKRRKSSPDESPQKQPPFSQTPPTLDYRI